MIPRKKQKSDWTRDSQVQLYRVADLLVIKDNLQLSNLANDNRLEGNSIVTSCDARSTLLLDWGLVQIETAHTSFRAEVSVMAKLGHAYFDTRVQGMS